MFFILQHYFWQEAEPNDRKIAKLCEYASRNPLRVPKVMDFCIVVLSKREHLHYAF